MKSPLTLFTALALLALPAQAEKLEHWLKLLKDDDRAILTAAAKAEEAASLLLKLGGRASVEDEDDGRGGDTADALAA
jgi:antirestriction protein ArdC